MAESAATSCGEEQARIRWPVSAATGLLEAHVWQEGRDPDTPSVDFKGEKYAVLAGTWFKHYELFRAGNLRLWVDFGDRKQLVDYNELFEKGFRYEVKEVQHPEEPPSLTLVQNVAGFFCLAKSMAYGLYLFTSTVVQEKAASFSNEKGKEKEQ